MATAASLPLIIIIPLVIIVILIFIILYLRRSYHHRVLSENIKERPLPDLFSNVYVSHKAFKKDVLPPPADTSLLKTNSVRVASKSEISVFREEALTAAQLIYSGPKSAPAYPGHSTHQKANLVHSRSSEALA